MDYSECQKAGELRGERQVAPLIRRRQKRQECKPNSVQVHHKVSQHTTRGLWKGWLLAAETIKSAFGIREIGKERLWLYAFNITPYCSMTSKELTNSVGPVTECPYGAEECNSQFFYDMSSSSGQQKRSTSENESYKARKKQNISVSQESCWFCLTNPEVQKQLLLSIGDHSYITLAKGGLVQDHLLIIPMEHVPSSINLSDSAEKEIEKYKNALVNYFHDKEYDVIFFERNFVSPHLQIQIVPIPKSRTSGITETIIEFAASQGLKFTELSKFSVLKQVAPPKKSYFYIEVVVNKKYNGKLLHVIEGNFPLQFGRMMLASKTILNVPDRVDWKECKMSPDEELRAAEDFRQSFKRYDFTIN
ncbi:CWF19-like protein 1 [Araneus ventricosus]|uniref:CWF19-like protein 1 n=1 Tax=Araneus ventricosus TaxID=182803 RepID=A0A4Y2GRQ3_ARAVE|nr:CWF19-like protein 1 [Araneus ventricosus]